MRMWMIDPKILCRKHLLGEHVEHHMFLGHLKKHKKVDGYLKNNCLEPKTLFQRHQALVDEMVNRGYNHNTPLAFSDNDISYLKPDQQIHKVDQDLSLHDLLNRCSICNERYHKFS